MDNTAPIVWLCVSDSLGNVTSTPYDIAPHKEIPKEENGLEARILALEERMKNYESHDADVERRKTVESGTADSTH